MSAQGCEEPGSWTNPAARTDRTVPVLLTEAVRRFQGPLLKYAAQLLPDRPDQAQDVVQETFLRLRKTALNGHRLDNPGGWLFRVTHNLAVDLNRRENRHCRFEEGMLQNPANAVISPPPPPGPAAAFSQKEVQQLALRELQHLPDPERQILLLKLIQNMTLREISEITDTNLKTVHYRLHTGIRKLTKRFKELGAM